MITHNIKKIRACFLSFLFFISYFNIATAQNIDTDLSSSLIDEQQTKLPSAVKDVPAVKKISEIRQYKCSLEISNNKNYNAHSFFICGKGSLVLDNTTGLMWKRCALGKVWEEKSQKCEGNALLYNWKESLNEVVKINKTAELFKDWRLPNIKELSSIVDTSCVFPAINQEYFPNTDNKGFWTSSVFEQYPKRAWFLNFALGNDYASDKRYFKELRPVRLGQFPAMENACEKYAPKKSSIVLIPDSDGKVGIVGVSNASGSATLEDAYTIVDAKSSKLEAPRTISKSETNKMFARALSAQPKQAIGFTLYFDTGATVLTQVSQNLLEESVQIIKQSKVLDIFIVGHCDTRGPSKLNEKLALERAVLVEKLIRNQLSTEQIKQIKVSSHGESEQLVKTADNIEEPKNRRVEVLLHL